MKVRKLTEFVLFCCVLGIVLTGCSVGSKDYEYVGGYPTDATIEKAFDRMDVERGNSHDDCLG